ncbi:MAG: tyrosine--tRNA ligase [Deltaproteobacteria bacterium]|nr:tyrosine--tRNA ligase [Deltaproteobacteria bacterium]
MNPSKIVEDLLRGVVDVLPEGGLLDRIESAAQEDRPLRVKLGADPSAPDLHLGHTVVLRKLRQFQDFGHVVIFLIGDFTARIGDPSGRSETRRPLDAETVAENARTYTEQVFKVLDRTRTEVRFNSEWMSAMSADDVVRLCAHYTVARILERDDFSKRMKDGRPIGIHEFLYPLVQGYDSVALKADIELGGTDQRFNLLVGRELQKAFGVAPQVVMTLPLLEGTDGVQKMSKSLNNYVGLTEAPDEMFGKIMSISDMLMSRWYSVLEPEIAAEVAADLQAGRRHPRETKALLAERQVARFWNPTAAAEARRRFDERFAKRSLADDLIPEEARPGPLPAEIALPGFLADAGLAKSNSEARRLISQGAVRINGVRVSSERYSWKSSDRAEGGADRVLVVEVGKRRVRKFRFLDG